MTRMNAKHLLVHLPHSHNHGNWTGRTAWQNTRTSPPTKVRTLERLLHEWGTEVADIAQTFRVVWDLDTTFPNCLYAVGEKRMWQQG